MTVNFKKKEPPQTSGTIVLMLGLYLILLAFFILLNAISEVAQDKFERASESIASGFGFQAAQTVIKEDPDEAIINKFYEELADEIQEVFSSYLSKSQFNVENKREVMLIRLRPSAFFDSGKWNLLSSQTAFFTDLANLMKQKRAGVVLELDIRVPEGTEAAKDQAASEQTLDTLELSGLRASQFARALAERDVPSDHLTAAVTEQEGSEIILMFTTTIVDRTAVLNMVRSAQPVRGR